MLQCQSTKTIAFLILLQLNIGMTQGTPKDPKIPRVAVPRYDTTARSRFPNFLDLHHGLFRASWLRAENRFNSFPFHARTAERPSGML